MAGIHLPRLAAVLALAAFSLLALHPLVGERYGDGHDAWIYPTRLVEFETAVREGQIPPVWAAHLGKGHGQPHFQFVPPLPSLLALPFRFLDVPLGPSLQLPLALLYAASAAAVYRIARMRRAGRVAAVASAVAWLFAPYVAVDLYVRVAIAEATAVGFAPIAWLTLLRLLDAPGPRRLAAASLATAPILLSHNAIALLFVGAVGLFACTRLRRGGMVAIGSLGYALGLTAFFWLPALVERHYVKIERLRGNVSAAWPDPLGWVANAFAAASSSAGRAVYERHAISPLQLLWSPWGYGDSHSGRPDEMSFALGVVHLLLGVVAVIAAWQDPDRGRGRERLVYVGLALLGAWLATTTSMWLWSHVLFLQYLAFPWRALFLPALFLALAATAVFERIGVRATIVAMAALVLWNLPHVGHFRSVKLAESRYVSEVFAREGFRASGVGEYAPRWSDRRTPYWPDRIRAPDDSVVDLEEIDRRGAHEVYDVEARRDTVAWAAPFYYPGWRVFVGPREVEIRPASDTGTIEFDLPRGKQRVRLEFGPTPVRLGASLTSLLALVVLVGFVVVSPFRVSRVGISARESARDSR